MKKIAVVGLGYVGLPMASLSAKQGYHVVGYELNSSVVSQLKLGKSHIKDETVERLLQEAVDSNNFYPTSYPDSIKDCSIYLICVPTPVDENNDPDLTPLISSVELVSQYLDKNDLLIIESTIFPGTCEEVVIPLIEEMSGLKAGSEFHVAHCPERVNPGDAFWTSENIPRVVGATTEQGNDLAAEFYSSILGGCIYDVKDVKGALRPKFSLDANNDLKVSQVELASVTKMKTIRDAEAVKAMENTVRDVNIAFVNELAKISDVLDLDVVDIIDGMSTKPFGKGPFYPGIGVGGHCIAVDPEWLKAASKKAGYMPEIIELSRMTNNSMPDHSVSLLQDLLNEAGLPVKNTKVAVLGVAYKKHVDDPRESPFYEVKELLLKKGAVLNVYDSWYLEDNTCSSLEEAVKSAKAIIINTDHDDIVDFMNALEFKNTEVQVIVDGRNCLNSEHINNQGVKYQGIGRK